MRRPSSDLGLGLATLTLAAVYYALAARIPASLLADSVGPQGLPKIYAVLLSGLSLILIARSLRRTHSAPSDPGSRIPDPVPDPRSPIPGPRRALLLLLIGVLYVVAVPWLGYLLSLAILLMATTYHEGGILNRRVALVSVAGAVSFWLLFVVLLRIPEPPGLWPALF